MYPKMDPPPLLLVLALVAAVAAPVRAQHPEPPDPAAYALRDVTLVRADGSAEDGIDIVVRGSFIEAIGEGLEIPADARVLEGESLRVYPGIVDAHGGAGFELPEPRGDRSDVDRWDPPRDWQGFVPHRRVADHLTATGSSLADARRDGVVAGAAIPDDGLAPGRAAFLLYRRDAAEPRGLVLDADAGHVLAFDRSRVYPSTLFGVIAFLRQQFLDARRDGEIRGARREDPRGITAPAWDPAYATLREIAAGEGRVFFRADGAEDIRRALDLGAELGFRPIVVGGEGAWKVTDRLREEGVTVLVSLDFGEPERWDPDEDTVEARLDPEVLREKRRFEERYAAAGRLAEAGVAFALTSGGGEAEIRDGVRTAMEHGLGEEAALRAVTATPARLLGAPELARIEEGLPGTFVVVDGPLFAGETKVAYTFVDGRLEEGGSDDEAATEDDSPSSDRSAGRSTDTRERRNR